MERLKTGFVDVELTRLVKADWNYKTDDENKSVKLMDNIKRNGQIENIIVRELPTGFYEVVNGNHRYDVLVALKLTTCHVYNLGAISEQHAKRITIETNETRFASDNVKLAQVLDELIEEFGLTDLAETMPFTEDEMANMQKMLNFDWDQFQEGDGEGGDDNGSSSEPQKLMFIIAVNKDDDLIEDELQEICDKYPSAKLSVKHG